MIVSSRKAHITGQKLRQLLSRHGRKGLWVLVAGIVLFCGWRLIAFWNNRLLAERSFSFGWGKDHACLGTIDASARRFTVLPLPPSLLVPAAGGRGTYPLRGYPILVSLTQENQLTRQSLSLLFQVPLLFWEENWECGDSDLKEAKRAVARAAWQCFWGEKSKVLTRADCFRVWWLVSRTKDKESAMIDLNQENLLDEVEYALQPAYRLSEVYGEKKVDWWTDERMKQNEGVYGVANATDTSGLAGIASAFIENLGGSVVKVGEWPHETDRCQLIIKEGQEKMMAYPVSRLRRYFDCDVVEASLENFVVDVVLVVGSNFQRFVDG